MFAFIVAALDPTVKVAIIVAIPSAITGIGTLVLGWLNRKESKRQFDVLHGNMTIIKENVNGALTKLRAEKDIQATQLIDAKVDLSYAEGRREGIEAKEKKP